MMRQGGDPSRDGDVGRGAATPPKPIAVAGARIPTSAVVAVLERMRREPFRMSDLLPVAERELAASGGPLTVAYQVIERIVRRAVRDGRIERLDPRTGRVATWGWVDG